MNSVLSTFATHWLRPGPHLREPARPRAPHAFGRKRNHSLGTAIMAALAHGYRAAQRAQMRRIRMELALHGVRFEHNPEPKTPASGG
jgi:hypothetical protein